MERTVPAAMILKLRKSTQSELVAAMGRSMRGNGPSSGRTLQPSGSRGMNSALSSPIPLAPSPVAASATTMTTDIAFHDAMGLAPPDANLSLTLEAFSKSLATEEASKPASLQPPRRISPTGTSPTLSGVSSLYSPQGRVDNAADGLTFDVELWRSDMLTSVLELNIEGNIIGGGLANPLCPPGESFESHLTKDHSFL